MSEQIPEQMWAWAVKAPAPIESDPCPLQLVKKPVPTPAPGEVLVKVLACGVCHTDSVSYTHLTLPTNSLV